KAGERMSARVPDETVVVSDYLGKIYREQHGCEPVLIVNGVDARPAPPASLVRERFGVEPGSYALFVGRFVPEKAPDVLLQAFEGMAGDRRLVIAGGSSFTTEYTEELTRAAGRDPR